MSFDLHKENEDATSQLLKNCVDVCNLKVPSSVVGKIFLRLTLVYLMIQCLYFTFPTSHVWSAISI